MDQVEQEFGKANPNALAAFSRFAGEIGSCLNSESFDSLAPAYSASRLNPSMSLAHLRLHSRAGNLTFHAGGHGFQSYYRLRS
jgi:hypothetical protein